MIQVQSPVVSDNCGECMISGVRVTGFASRTQAAEFLLARIAQRSGGYAIATNAEKLVALRNDAALLAVMSQATLNYPDGIGAVLALRQNGIRSARVAGADLWLEVLVSAVQSGKVLRIAIVGAKQSVLDQALTKLRDGFPTMQIVLARDGYGGASDEARLVRDLVEAQPELVLLALGSPRQELMMRRVGAVLSEAMFMGLGGSLDVLVGTAVRAPAWMQDHGLEWLHRLLRQPSRIFRQRRLVMFVTLLLMRRL
jgi:UDP-N-acetyl-D-mannosaminouronate:lipid I N-acetyl-D-mannosaminouronosyltransferase